MPVLPPKSLLPGVWPVAPSTHTHTHFQSSYPHTVGGRTGLCLLVIVFPPSRLYGHVFQYRLEDPLILLMLKKTHSINLIYPHVIPNNFFSFHWWTHGLNLEMLVICLLLPLELNAIFILPIYRKFLSCNRITPGVSFQRCHVVILPSQRHPLH